MTTEHNPYAIGETASLRRLNSEDYTLIQNEQDLESVLEYVPDEKVEELQLFEGDSITGAVVKHGDGEYDEIWLTTDSAYYALGSTYTRVA